MANKRIQFGRTKRQSTFSEKELEYIWLDNFTPGIHDDYYANGGAGSFPEGSAQVTNTWGCIGAPNGGLIPAPNKVLSITQGLIDQNLGGVHLYPNNDPNMHITALRCMSPVGYRSSDTNGTSTYPDALWLGYMWVDDANGNNGNIAQSARVRLFKVYNLPKAAISTYDAVSLTSTSALGAWTNPPSQAWYDGISIDNGRSDVTDPTKPGAPVTIIGASATNRYTTVYYPAINTTSDGVTLSWLGSNASGANLQIKQLLCHQNRVIAFTVAETTAGTYGPATSFAYSDIYYYSTANDFTNGVTTPGIFYTENPSGLGSWVSMNNNELFLVKLSGGAMSVRGDVATPTVVRLPGVEPTGYDSKNLGDIMHGGSYAYGSDSGFWEWSGGNKSTSLTEGKLSKSFWQMPQMANHAIKGKSSYIHPFLFTPNNYCYDTRTKGWWRYANPTTNGPYAFCETNALGNLITAPAYVNNTANETAAYWDLNTGQPYYTWQSHPLPMSQTRLMEISELTVLAQPYSTTIGGTITITLNGVSNSGGQTQVKEVFPYAPGSKPGAITIPTQMQGYDMTIRIESQSSDNLSPAPRLYHLGLGAGELTTARN